MKNLNPHQIKDWNGKSGESWVVHQDWLDRMLAPFGSAAIAAASPAQGEQILDIGCGAGATSLALAELVGEQGRVLGIDISEPLLARARELAPADAPVSFLLNDASRAPLHARSFDLLFSRFGVMFFTDPAAAFSHMRTALKPGGRFTFVCWRSAAENDWTTLPLSAIRAIVPLPPPPAEAPGPFSFGDRERVRDILRRAGFRDIAFAAFDREIVYGEGAAGDAALDDAVRRAFEVGPLSRALAEHPETIRIRAAEAVRSAFATRLKGSSVVINGAAWIVTARNTD